MAQITGGELIARLLQAEGITRVFGIIDGTYLNLFTHFKPNGIDFISPRHETCAAHMAGAYARLTGTAGVCIASNGPGVANILPGVAVENGEGNRVLLITSTRRTGIGYPERGGTFQYFDQVGVTRPMTKWSAAVPSFDRIPEFFQRAFRKLYQGRPGVVHVDIPENIINGKGPDISAAEPGSYRRVSPLVPADDEVLKAAELLASARLPLIHAGSGVIHAQAFAELKQVADLLQSPVSTSWGGRSAFPEDSPLAMPMNQVEMNQKARNDADVVLTLGSRLGETDWWGKQPYWGSPKRQKMIQVDIDEDMLGVNKPVLLAISGDIRIFLKKLLKALEQMKLELLTPERKKYLSSLSQLRDKHRSKLDKVFTEKPNRLTAAHVARACEEIFNADAICVVDGGNTAVWAHFYRKVTQPNTVLSTFKFGMLGAGVSQALGAAVALPDRQVYAIMGDGAMGFHMQEIETAVRNNLPVIYLVCCDRQWGMVKMTQQFALKPVKTMLKKSLDPGETINADFHEIRFDLLAESMGAHGERVGHPDELVPAIRRCLEQKKCSVIHVDVDPVKHLWAPNLMVFKKMHEEPES